MNRVDIRHNKPGIGSLPEIFSFSNHIPASTPAVPRSVGKLLEDTRSLAGTFIELFSGLHLGFNNLLKPRILG